MGTYATKTQVGSDASRAEIERTLTRYGATSFVYGWNAGHAMIGFAAADRQVRFVLPLPDRADPEFTTTPTTGRPRTASAAEAAYEQAVRQRWRALALVVKAKLEAVEAGIVSFDQEFYAHLVLPGGRTVYEESREAFEAAQITGTVAPLLQLPGRP